MQDVPSHSTPQSTSTSTHWGNTHTHLVTHQKTTQSVTPRVSRRTGQTSPPIRPSSSVSGSLSTCRWSEFDVTRLSGPGAQLSGGRRAGVAKVRSEPQGWRHTSNSRALKGERLPSSAAIGSHRPPGGPVHLVTLVTLLTQTHLRR